MQAHWYYLWSMVSSEVGWGEDLVTLQVMTKEMHLILVIQGLGIQIDFWVCSWAASIKIDKKLACEWLRKSLRLPHVQSVERVNPIW